MELIGEEFKPVQIKLFSILADRLGDEIVLDLPNKLTGVMVLDQMKEVYPDLASVIDQCRIAINQTFIDLSSEVKLTDIKEIAIIPPVSGG